MCESEGARSLSDFLRSALAGWLGFSSGSGTTLASRLEHLSRRLDQLQADLRQLAASAPRERPFPTAGDAAQQQRQTASAGEIPVKSETATSLS